MAGPDGGPVGDLERGYVVEGPLLTRSRFLGRGPGGAVVGEAEVHEAGEVHSGAAVREPNSVAVDAAGAHFAVAAHDPCEGSCDSGPMLTVDGSELDGVSVAARSGEEVVVFVRLDHPTASGGRAQRGEPGTSRSV